MIPVAQIRQKARRKNRERVCIKGTATFHIAGETIVQKVKGKNVAVGATCQVEHRPRLSTTDCRMAREMYLAGCNPIEVVEAFDWEFTEEEIGDAIFGEYRYRWVKFFYRGDYGHHQRSELSASHERLPTDKSKASRVYCPQCGRRRRKKHIRESKRTDLSVWIVRDGCLIHSVACSSLCQRQAKRRLKREIEWTRQHRYWIEMAKKQLRRLRRVLGRRVSPSVASEPRVTSQT